MASFCFCETEYWARGSEAQRTEAATRHQGRSTFRGFIHPKKNGVPIRVLSDFLTRYRGFIEDNYRRQLSKINPRNFSGRSGELSKKSDKPPVFGRKSDKPPVSQKNPINPRYVEENRINPRYLGPIFFRFSSMAPSFGPALMVRDCFGTLRLAAARPILLHACSATVRFLHSWAGRTQATYEGVMSHISHRDMGCRCRDCEAMASYVELCHILGGNQATYEGVMSHICCTSNTQTCVAVTSR